LSTHSANEAVEANMASTAARQHLPRPHLVSNTEIATPSEAIAVEISSGSAGDFAPGFRATELGNSSYLQAPPVPRFASWSFGALAKRTLDIAGAVTLGIVFSPLMLVIVALTRREGGSVIYLHRRVGQDGKAFGCLKFRTMVPDADQVLRELLERDPELRAEWVRDHKLRNDPRVTPLGRFLRRTSLDELPQIWNVIRGEMSLVGPRPVVREELLRYGRSVRVYLSTKPGITGLWQVTGRNDTDYRRRVALDAYYARNWTLRLDLYILLKTTRVVVRGGGAY
jgi:Undecaprenyl-phosphate galactose phosphotransferase WbaP